MIRIRMMFALSALLVMTGCPEPQRKPAPHPVVHHRVVPPKPVHPGHEHAHAHPHALGDHHHHPHPHPHLAGPNGHHHPY